MQEWKSKYEEVRGQYEMVQEYLDSVKNIEVVEREQMAMREKLHIRQQELVKREEALVDK